MPPLWQYFSRVDKKRQTSPSLPPKGAIHCPLRTFACKYATSEGTATGTAGALLSPPGRGVLRAASDPRAGLVSAGRRTDSVATGAQLAPKGRQPLPLRSPHLLGKTTTSACGPTTAPPRGGVRLLSLRNPIFWYHHIVPWEIEHHFRPEDMMVLCPNHATESDALAIDEASQRKLKRRPYNIRHGYAAGQITVDQRSPSVQLGKSVEMAGVGPLIVIGRETVLGLAVEDEGRLLLSLRLYSRKDDLLATIERNEWRAGDPLPWDLDFKYRRLAIRNARRKIALEIDAQKDPLQVRAELWRGGQRVGVGPRGIELSMEAGIKDLSIIGGAVWVDERTGKTKLGPQSMAPRSTSVTGRNQPCPCGSGRKYKLCHGA